MSELRHGHTRGGKKTAIYSRWRQMRRRCSAKGDIGYSLYGARGISVCKRWAKFEAFLADMGEPPPSMTLERIDNSKGYKPSNCKWATTKEQSWNKRTVRFLTFNGQTKPIKVWEKELGFGIGTLRRRFLKGVLQSELFNSPREDRP